MPFRQTDPWPSDTRSAGGWLRDHRRVGGESFYFVSARLGTSLLVWLVVGIALALPAGLWIIQVNMAEVSAGWEGRPGLSVYFDLDATQAEIDDTAAMVGQQGSITQVEVTTQDEALAEFKVYSGLGDSLSLLGENPLPASMRALLTPGVVTAELDRLAAQIGKREGVAEVVVEKTWLERLNDLSAVVRRLGLMLGVLFGIGAILVTASSVRLAIEARLEELRVLKLVGATSGQIRRPFLYFGALYGFGGGVIAAMLIALTLLILEPPLTSLLGSYQRELNLSGFDPLFLLWLLAAGSLLGVIGSMVAVRQRLSRLEVL